VYLCIGVSALRLTYAGDDASRISDSRLRRLRIFIPSLRGAIAIPVGLAIQQPFSANSTLNFIRPRSIEVVSGVPRPPRRIRNQLQPKSASRFQHRQPAFKQCNRSECLNLFSWFCPSTIDLADVESKSQTTAPVSYVPACCLENRFAFRCVRCPPGSGQRPVLCYSGGHGQRHRTTPTPRDESRRNA
jgi:hypothetical protein